MTPTQQHATLATASGEVVFDRLTRTLYATDASHHEIEPLAVGFPRDAKQAASMIRAAAQAGVSVTPRGAGTGLVGGALGDGLVIDFARHNRWIGPFNPDTCSLVVGAGVVLDQLNQYLKPLGFCFGPDVATSSRATIGGMIANNSSGARAAFYGTTADHVIAVDIVLADGSIATVGPARDSLKAQRELLEDIAALNALQIAEQFPPGLIKRLPGYALDRIVRDPGNLINVLAGSEGTLAGIVSAELKVVPLPEELGLGLIFFDSATEAMQATVELQDLQPVAVEHLDRILIDQTRGQRDFQSARDLLDFDANPCESVLAVEFYGDVEEKLVALERKKLGTRTRILQTMAQMNQLWALRKAGLSLLTSRKGDAKPVTGIEDAAVRVRDLPAYHEGLRGIMRRLGLQASFYGHAGAGLLHVRPVLDLHSADDLKKFRQVTEEVAALVRQFKGSFCAEHGVGLARTEFLRAQVGEECYTLMRQIKTAFDPHRLLNPGKIISDDRYRLDTKLRCNVTEPIRLPFEPVLAFAAQDESFVANLEQCNGCGGCRKDTPTMCPTYIATGDELLSTRGRANIIRTALAAPGFEGGDALRSEELEAALTNCLSCRACVNECPSSVNLPLLKAEMQAARARRDGVTLRQRVFSAVDKLGALGCKAPWLANMVLDSFFARQFLAQVLGLSTHRKLPHYARERFDVWFAQRTNSVKRLKRGRVILWDDTFARYHEPHVGKAAVKVLEAAGFEVILPTGRECCGRPAFSQGHLAKAAKLGRHNLAMLHVSGSKIPILFLEPSCYSMFAEDYREMKLAGAEDVAGRCFLFEEFLDDLLRREPGALRFKPDQVNVVVRAAVQGRHGQRRRPRALPHQGAHRRRLHAPARDAPAGAARNRD
ncbi:MAG: FAD-binding and (Fe-S)-binding domain-containing protein [Verrucomicrobia bacterium]|nr:FAD-binding and (Fe-S)-binding domain-containing protein [Verrucomicrobiota bacterium]